MNNTIFKRITIGLLAYIAIILGVFLFYKDNPENMDWQDREQYNKVKISGLELGMSKAHIIELMGPPDITEAKTLAERTVQVMFYRTQHRTSDGITTQDECTPLMFENESLVAWGEGTYQHYLER